MPVPVRRVVQHGKGTRGPLSIDHGLGWREGPRDIAGCASGRCLAPNTPVRVRETLSRQPLPLRGSAACW